LTLTLKELEGRSSAHTMPSTDSSRSIRIECLRLGKVSQSYNSYTITQYEKLFP